MDWLPHDLMSSAGWKVYQGPPCDISFNGVLHMHANILPFQWVFHGIYNIQITQPTQYLETLAWKILQPMAWLPANLLNASFKQVAFSITWQRLSILPKPWRWRERRPFVISASGSLDLVDLHGVGSLAGTIRDQSRGCGIISDHPIPLARPKS